MYAYVKAEEVIWVKLGPSKKVKKMSVELENENLGWEVKIKWLYELVKVFKYLKEVGTDKEDLSR